MQRLSTAKSLDSIQMLPSPSQHPEQQGKQPDQRQARENLSIRSRKGSIMTYKKASFTGRTQAWAEKQKKLASSRKATQGSISRTPAAPTVIPSPKPTPGNASNLKTSLRTKTPVRNKFQQRQDRLALRDEERKKRNPTPGPSLSI